MSPAVSSMTPALVISSNSAPMRAWSSGLGPPAGGFCSSIRIMLR